MQIIKNKISEFNYINKIKYKNIRFYLQIWWILKKWGGANAHPHMTVGSPMEEHIKEIMKE